MSELMSMSQAVQRGISRLRELQWADPHTYLRLDLLENGMHGPWVHLYIPNAEPEHLLCTIGFDWDSVDAEEYTGPLHPKDPDFTGGTK
jgi:hypothetical protein